ncbi:MAG: hypothetical protein GC183_10100 [Thiobacillus sp.]|nr:hypothetical protein [Thiobacillus sp.]
MTTRPIPAVLASLLLLGASNLALAADEPAQVATLDKAQGTVMVDQGKGFASFKAPAKLNEGDRVITLDGSGAEIVFNDGCRAQLKANNMMTIALNPGCKAAIVAVNGSAASGTVASAAAAGAPLSYLGFSALAAGTAYALFNSGNDDKPISGE